MVSGAGGLGADVTAAAGRVGVWSILDDPGPVWTGVVANTDEAGVDALGTGVTGAGALGVSAAWVWKVTSSVPL